MIIENYIFVGPDQSLSQPVQNTVRSVLMLCKVPLVKMEEFQVDDKHFIRFSVDLPPDNS